MTVQVKICGLSKPFEAEKCFEYGADAVGVVFFDKSPRNVSFTQAKEINDAANGRSVVAVTVDMEFEKFLELNQKTGIRWFQLHGNETPQLVAMLAAEGFQVIKKISTEQLEMFSDNFGNLPFLVESGKGTLPGGNGTSWNWQAARVISGRWPYLLAGGINQSNIRLALSSALPDGIDLSSAVESEPGKKDIEKIASFMDALREAEKIVKYDRKILRIF